MEASKAMATTTRAIWKVHWRKVAGPILSLSIMHPKDQVQPSVSNLMFRQRRVISFMVIPCACFAGMIIDGAVTDTLQCSGSAKSISSFTVGNTSAAAAAFNWCIASAYIVSTPFGKCSSAVVQYGYSITLDDDLARFVYYLGPRYASHLESVSKWYTIDLSVFNNVFKVHRVFC